MPDAAAIGLRDALACRAEEKAKLADIDTVAEHDSPRHGILEHLRQWRLATAIAHLPISLPADVRRPKVDQPRAQRPLTTIRLIALVYSRHRARFLRSWAKNPPG